MSDTLLQQEVQGKDELFKQAEQLQNPDELLSNSLDALDSFGGFDLLEGLVDGLDNMNPTNRAAKNIFLEESDFSEQRTQMKNDLAIWISLLSGNEKSVQLVDKCAEEKEKVNKSLKKNLKSTLKRSKKLESSYRTVSLFFKNSGKDKVDCLSILNADKDELKDSESKFFKTVSEEIARSYDRLNLKNNYSILVIPGYLGSKQAVDFWGKIAFKNKVMFVTDYADLPSLKMLKDKLDKDSMNGADPHLANVMLACNWVMGRKKSDFAGEDEHLYIPPSGALAGKLYDTENIVLAQGAAGKRYGTLDEVDGARLDLLKAEIASLIDKSVIPMVFEDNRVMAFSNKTLFSGNPIGLQEYPIVRVFDWIGKVFANFFNDVAFQNWNSQLKNDLKFEICGFLDDYKGSGKLIEDYNFKDIRQDEKTKDISIEIDLKPFFAAKNFYIKLTGHEGAGGKEWKQEVQDK